MQLKLDIVDAFTDTQFRGNSAAVVITERWLSDSLMQQIASENNLSETAFLVPARGLYHVRWFSPLSEIDFCGHATLAAAHVLFGRHAAMRRLRFFAPAVGEMEITLSLEGLIEMNFPVRMPSPVADVPEALLLGLSIAPQKILRNTQAYFAVYSDEADVIQITTNSDLLKRLAPYDVVVTAASSEYDFVSRYFWPANGGDEDPVTGSIHTGLAPYWSGELRKTTLRAYQASKRGGLLYCRVSQDRVTIAGQAVSYLHGEIRLQTSTCK
ncbi:phenazine biosynthesis protein PhzF [Arenicella chitinivorans]|uniref:Phenazine biosynthesis protein PhzF n=1 Tax=Arenicella chitinivorans TaxID=1329800 RepID=A0A918RV21_9GAMM|nr:PhzF family phenazine biosynthesis protein [Arenicella chitinivorans]GHA12267.1 phenazine biosynthesis protein PhzF [Arenicella chitinivorans]